MANSTKHIRELCDDRKIDYKQLHQLILKSMENDGNYDYPDPSIVNKWYNCKTKSIDEKYVRYVADALGVSENEIRLGKPAHFGQEDMERVYRFLEEKREERIRRTLNSGIKILALLLGIIGLVLLLYVLERGHVINLHPDMRVGSEEKESEKVGRDYMSDQKDEAPVKTPISKIGEWIEVSYEEQKLYYYEGENLLFTSDIVTGNEDTEIIPYGTYHVLYKTTDATLTGEDYEKHVDYWIGFDEETDGHMVGFHDASWRTVFGGDEWKNNPTLECINMPTDKVKQLYEAVDLGTEIRIHD